MENKIIAIFFIFFIVLLALLTLFSPNKAIISQEGELPIEFPEITANQVLSGTYREEMNTFLHSHAVLGRQWSDLAARIDRFTMRSENNGVFINDGHLIEHLAAPNITMLEKNITGINEIATKTKLPVFAMIVPTASEVQEQYMPEFSSSTTWNQLKVILQIQQSISENVQNLDIYTPLRTLRNENIYYRTDEHWTSKGAYAAYHTIGKHLGFEPESLSRFSIEGATASFYGSLYARAGDPHIDPDVIQIYKIGETDATVEMTVYRGEEQSVYPSLYFREYLDGRDKYAVFLGEDAPKIVIKTDVKTDKKLYLFKDSYANAVVPFLAQHYSEITLIDMRYCEGESLADFAIPDDYTEVLFLYGIEAFVQESLFPALETDEE